MNMLALILAVATPGVEPELFTLLDGNADGVVELDELSDSQKPAFRRALRVADFNEDGKLTAKELQVALNPSKPVDVSRRNNRQFDVSRLDRNRDGKLTKDEVPRQLLERMEQLFTVYGKEIPIQILKDRYQTPGSSKKSEPSDAPPEKNSMTKPEMMQRRMQQRPQANKSQNAQPEMAMLQRLDKNKDGRLSRSEVPSLMWNRLKQLDRNSDQAIDREEFAQGRRRQTGTKK